MSREVATRSPEWSGCGAGCLGQVRARCHSTIAELELLVSRCTSTLKYDIAIGNGLSGALLGSDLLGLATGIPYVDDAGGLIEELVHELMPEFPRSLGLFEGSTGDAWLLANRASARAAEVDVDVLPEIHSAMRSYWEHEDLDQGFDFIRGAVGNTTYALERLVADGLFDASIHWMLETAGFDHLIDGTPIARNADEGALGPVPILAWRYGNLSGSTPPGRASQATVNREPLDVSPCLSIHGLARVPSPSEPETLSLRNGASGVAGILFTVGTCRSNPVRIAKVGAWRQATAPHLSEAAPRSSGWSDREFLFGTFWATLALASAKSRMTPAWQGSPLLSMVAE